MSNAAETAPSRTSTGHAPSPLSVVMPVYNEGQHIASTLRSLLEALDAAHWPAEVVVVDDGSTDDTAVELDTLQDEPRLVVIHTQNQGRFRARAEGLARASAQMTLLLDARVTLHAGALEFLRAQLAHTDRQLWNGDVTINTRHNPFAAFWSVIVRFGWRRYFLNRTTTSFGLEDFDLFPKGTGCFVAPTDWLRKAVEEFRPAVNDIRFSSDDTRLLRALAARARIHISPEFMCTYEARDNLRAFVQHSYFRGTTFVDGYLASDGHTGRLFRGLLVAGPVAAGCGVVLAARAPRRVTAAAAASAGGIVVGALRLGSTPREAVSFVLLLPTFTGSFTAGVARGLILSLRGRGAHFRH